MLKGTSKIELTDVNTGKKEVYEDTNMVTNAISDIFSKNIGGQLFRINDNQPGTLNNIVPLAKNGIGGILLFSDPLEEDANKYFAPSTNPCIGYASIDVNSTSNELRGSLNLNESYEVENGYKFVWDFTTSQANGTISAMALTHKNVGRNYVGDMYSNSKVWNVKQMTANSDFIVRRAYQHMVEGNVEENYFWSIGLTNASKILIQKCRYSFSKVGLLDPMDGSRVFILEEHEIVPSIFVYPANYNYGRYDFHDGKNGYWYGFWHDANSSGNAVVKWIKIDKKEFTYTEGTWTFPNTYMNNVGYGQNYDSYPYKEKCTIIRNGYWYVMSYDCKSLYKVNIENPVDITQIKLGFQSSYYRTGGYDNHGGIYVYAMNDWLVYSDFLLDADDVPRKVCDSGFPFDQIQTPFVQHGPFLLGFGQYYGRATTTILILILSYLATINNLDTAVIKTADKTMKITYTIQEVDEEESI